MRICTAFRRVLVLPLGLATAGCVGALGTIGTLGTIAELVTSVGRPGPSPQQVRLTAEVRQVDVRRQVLQVETADGRAGGVLFDLGTTVVHEHRPYPLNALQEGDVVSLLLEDAPQSNLYARRIEVVRLAQPELAVTWRAAELPAPPAPDTAAAEVDPQPRALEGEVGAIDAQRGRFQLHPEDGPPITVTLPFNPPADVAKRFDQLRTGEEVQLEGYPLGTGRVELHRFTDTAPAEPESPAPAEPAGPAERVEP